MEYKDTLVTFEDSKITDWNGMEVMMSWEAPIMEKAAEYICQSKGDILEIGFGMGISAGYIQSHSISSHTIIENHPQIITKAQEWANGKSNVTIINNSWYNVKDNLSTYDGIFYDTYGDTNMNNFSSSLSSLTKIGTKVTWWNNNINESNYYNIPNVNYQAININPPTNSYFNSSIYYLPKKEF